MPSWTEHQAELAAVAARQMFFIGGAPRSGTTWVQQILDAHPEISCHGEGLFHKHLAEPLEALMAERRHVLEAKNTGLFGHTGGYKLPGSDDIDVLVGTGVLLAMHRQSAGKDYRAIGEKTPENVFFFPKLKQLFPRARLIAIARDPRDVLTSAWHFFHKPVAGEDETKAKLSFIQLALPSLAQGARVTIELGTKYPADVMLVTYENLRRTPQLVVSNMFRFLGVSDSSAVVADCVERTSFAALSGGRPAGVEQKGSFFRKGVSGDWTSTLTPEMNEIMMRELGWMFPHFGWKA